MGHDQLFKMLLETFLQEFLELFFPEVAKRLDFTSERHLDKEFFTDLPEGRRREADVVAELGRGRASRSSFWCTSRCRPEASAT